MADGGWRMADGGWRMADGDVSLARSMNYIVDGEVVPRASVMARVMNLGQPIEGHTPLPYAIDDIRFDAERIVVSGQCYALR
jgi:hypothetical protein